MPLRLRSELPEFQGVTEWVNGEVSKESLKAQPVLVHFWAISCHMCKEGLPILNQWREKYGQQYNLQITGIHMPRSEKDTDIAAVKEAIARYGLKHPIAIDNEHEVTDVYRNEYVPAYYLFDGKWQLRFYGAGEKAIGMVEQRLAKILGPKTET